MIEVELPDGTIAEFPEGTPRDTIQSALQKRFGGQQQEPRSFGDMVYENVIGRGEVDTPGERLGELIRGGGAAVARGMADVPALPANLLQLGTRGVEAALGMDEPSAVSRGLQSLPDTRDMLASVPVIGPESQYQAPGTAGEYVSTMGEFAGGAGLMGGPSAAVRYGAVPGAASETAGQATEGTAIEPYARAGAGIAAALMAAPKPGAFAGSAESSRMANTLQQKGVQGVTAGQARQSPRLMGMEGRLEPTAQQLDDFTAAAMRETGSRARLATPEALRAAGDDLVAQMDDAVRGASIVPSTANAQAASNVAKNYVDRVPQGMLTPRMRGIADEIKDLADKGKPASLSQIREWRSDIGRLTTSPDAATREAAHGLRGLLDDMTDTALTAAGRRGDIAKLADAREKYRNFIAVRDASSRAGAEGGSLSPTQLNQSVIRSQGRENYATGRTTPMADLTRAGAGVLRPAPTVRAGGVRSFQDAFPIMSAAGVGGAALQAGASPIVAGLMGAGAAGIPAAAQSAMRSNIAQALMRDPRRAITQMAPVLPGLMSGQ